MDWYNDPDALRQDLDDLAGALNHGEPGDADAAEIACAIGACRRRLAELAPDRLSPAEIIAELAGIQHDLAPPDGRAAERTNPGELANQDRLRRLARTLHGYIQEGLNG